MKSFVTQSTILVCCLMVLTYIPVWSQESDHLSMTLNFEDAIIRVHAKYRTISIEKIDSIYFLLNPSFQIDTIQSIGLTDFRLTEKVGRPFPFWCLKYDEAIDVGETIIVEFKYSINLMTENHMASDWIELSADKLWFPNFGDLNNEFTYEVSITNFPSTYTLITHSDAKISTQGNHLHIKKELPWYEVLIIGGKDMREWKYKDEISIIGNVNIADSTLQSIGEKVDNSIDYLNNAFGASDPVGAFRVILRNTKRDELGYQFNRRNMIVTGVDFNDYANLSHEIAHFWWSKANFIDEPWINESFANYSMYLVLKKFDPEKYTKLLESNREATNDAIPVIHASLFTENSYDSYYHKGAILLIELENKIGTEVMLRLLDACISKGIKTTSGLLKELELQTNAGQAVFFENLMKK